MNTLDKEYFEARAEQEVRMAQNAEHANAVRAHYLLADMYLDRVHGEIPDKPPPLVWADLESSSTEKSEAGAPA